MKKTARKEKTAWGQYVGMGFFVLIGAACGFIMMAYMDACMHAGRTLGETLPEVALLIAGMYAAIAAQLILHEAGHLAFGLMTGYRFCSFRVFSLIWVKIGGRIRLRRLSIAGTGGQCLMAPPEMKNGKIPVTLYNLGGSIMNLLTGAAALAAALVIISLVIRFDAFGAQKYVPDVNQIESAQINTYAYDDVPSVRGLKDPQGLEKLTALHKAILEQGCPTSQEIDQINSVPTSEYSGDQDYFTFSITYTLKDGSTIRRSYSQIVRRGTPLYEAANAFYNDPAVRQVSYDDNYLDAEIESSAITGGWFNNYKQDGGSAELTGTQARQLYAAVQRYYETGRQKTIDVLDAAKADRQYACFYLEILYRDDTVAATVSGNGAEAAKDDCSWGIDNLPADCTEVLDLLVSFGLAENTAELLYD